MIRVTMILSNRPRLRLLVHKPTFACTARCTGCSRRRALHSASRGRGQLTFEQQVELYRQAADLGARTLHISGGEPTLYPRLAELVAAGKRLGFYVMLNSNGALLARRGLASRLLDAGLDAVMLSLYSHRESVHDALRQQPGLWRRAVASLDCMARLRKERAPGFLLVTQSIMARDNLFDAPELLRMVGLRGSDVHLFSYVEGDWEARMTPTVQMLRRFRASTLDQMRRAVSRLPDSSPVMQAVARWRLGGLFDPRRNAHERYARAEYHATASSWRQCKIPREFMLVLPDGDVHPCNVVEYTHEPVVGNFLTGGLDLASIWEGAPWRRFRRTRHHWCGRCPMTHHSWVPLNLTVGRLARFLRGRL